MDSWVLNTRHEQQLQSVYVWIGLARAVYIRCLYGNIGREITKYTVIYGIYIRFGQPYIRTWATETECFWHWALSNSFQVHARDWPHWCKAECFAPTNITCTHDTEHHPHICNVRHPRTFWAHRLRVCAWTPPTHLQHTVCLRSLRKLAKKRKILLIGLSKLTSKW